MTPEEQKRQRYLTLINAIEACETTINNLYTIIEEADDRGDHCSHLKELKQQYGRSRTLHINLLTLT